MFINLFHCLRRRGIAVSLNEWLALQQSLDANLADSSLTRFYYLARSILVKSEAHYDRYDLAFLECFRGLETGQGIVDRIEREMVRLAPDELLGPETIKPNPLELDEVSANFLEQLRAGNYRRHAGGSQAIGVRGSSTQGAGGFNPAGVRIGQGHGRHRNAIQIAERRNFENYRDDIELDTRAMKLALQYLRQVVREGPKEQLDLTGTIDATCRNAGELEFVWERERKRRIKLLLLMDAGGTMSPHAATVSRLFSAAKDVVRDLRFYYFHNCVYQDLYTDISQRTSIPTRKALEQTDRSYKVILVGDAYMAPSELLSPNGAIDFWYRNNRAGIEWLKDIDRRFRRAIWLNPEPARWWNEIPTTRKIREVFPMFELNLQGLREAVRKLVR